MKNVPLETYQYTAIFDLNEDDGYTVTVPSLPGLVTEGKNLEEAKTMAEEAIRCYLQGLKNAHEDIPEEKEIDQVRVTVKV